MVLGYLMTIGLSKDIRCHVWPYFSKLAKKQIRQQASHKVVCQPGDCLWSHFNLPQGFVWVNIYSLYHPLRVLTNGILGFKRMGLDKIF